MSRDHSLFYILSTHKQIYILEDTALEIYVMKILDLHRSKFKTFTKGFLLKLLINFSCSMNVLGTKSIV